MKNKNNHNNYKMDNNINKCQKLLICIYTNKDKNEFAIGLKDDEHFRAMTKVDEFYTRFVDAFDQVLNDENEVYWKQALKRWIAAAKKDETIFVEVDLSGWNELGERMKK
ncbi:MAG: hypothetical protein ACJ71H_12015 [Nitrososphaeraceae archaeon]